ncbi:hypothetical protein BHM03_00056020 [Ensete ventricosum]|nr:hypothetical protein BHM03_00056020 [Ensete ventricosum]
MKSHHDFDSTVCLESLGSVRKRFSIPNEYVLHAPRSGQRPYHHCPGGFGISIDALEAGLRFPLHPVIGECLNWWQVSPGQIVPNSWHFGIEWSTHSISNVPSNLSDEETNMVERLKGILSASRAIRNLTEEWLVEAGLSLASRGMPYPFVKLRYLISQLMVGSAEMHHRLHRSHPPSPGQPPTCRRFPSRRPGARQKPLGNVGGKGLADTSVKPPASRQRPKSVRELCSARVGVDDHDYHAIQMCNLPKQASDAPLDPNLRPLTHGTSVCQSGEASATYIQGVLLPRLALDLYTLTSEVLMDRAAKAMVLVSTFSGFSCTFPFFFTDRPLGFQNQHYQAALFDRGHDAGRVITSLDGKTTLLRQELQDLKEGGNPDAVAAAEVRAVEVQSVAEHLRNELEEANGRRASVEAELEKTRSESASLERQLADIRERLGDSEGQLRSARAQVRQMETKLLDLARSKEALREDLPKRAIEEYKESPGFEMGLVRMGRVSLEYEYQLALTRLQPRHPGVEIELDPFVTLPENADITMADEQPFDDSLSSPEE